MTPADGLTHTDINALIEDFSFLTDWEEKYGYVLDLGKKLPDFPESFKTDVYKVRGCVSQVWVSHDYHAETDKMSFIADSDSALVRGLLALAVIAYSGRSPAAILEIDFKEIFTALGLSEHLTPQRSNGLFSVIERIRAVARAQENVSLD